MTTKIHMMDNRDNQTGITTSLCGQPQSTGPEAEALIKHNIDTGLKVNQFNSTFCPDCVRLYKVKHAYKADAFEDIEA